MKLCLSISVWNFPALALGIIFAAAITSAPNAAFASGPDGSKAADDSVAAEMASLRIHDDFDVNLFADESLGIANPIALQWDHRGRAWVLCTLAYAQLKPGEVPNDKLLILEDTDHDGRADTSTVFLDGLDMPTGFALGHGGAWIAEGADLIHVSDTDGDDVGDEKRVVLTGFGTGDTHQNISNFTWDSGGFLYFSQGLHTDSHVETPWGVSRGDKAGFWRFDPRSTRLDPFCFPSLMSQNPCGIAFDRWDAMFVKSNNTDAVYVTPGLIPTTHPRNLAAVAGIGNTPGKSMGGDIVESSHLPGWIQNHMVIAGYFSRRVTALPLVEEQSGFAVVKPVELIYGEHVSFRPVDIQAGPDGAIYVVDWFNPIINHYQVSLRHPDRDYDHGRIWRLTAKGRPLNKAPRLEGLPPEKLFSHLKSPEIWVREQARRLLMDADPDKVIKPLQAWFDELDADSPAGSHAMLEAAGVLESHSALSAAHIERLASSKEARTRAAAARVISRANALPSNAIPILKKLAVDPHPRPRLEAVVACASISSAESLKIALTVLDSGMDRFIDYALGQTVHALESEWLPALESGEFNFVRPEHLAFALEAHGGGAAATLVRNTLKTTIDPSTRERLTIVLAKVGNADDLQTILDQPHPDAALLNTLIANWATRRLKPAAPYVPRLGELIDSASDPVRIAALRLAGLWRATPLAASIEKLALDAASPPAVRAPALVALGQLRGNAAREILLSAVTEAEFPSAVRIAALNALADIDLAAAAIAAAPLLAITPDSESASPLMMPFLNKSGGADTLAAALEGIDLQAAPAQHIAAALSRTGRTEFKLSAALNQAQGLEISAPKYDAAWVQTLAAQVRATGDPAKGKEIYNLPQTACVSCHKIEGIGGILGPDLSTVGAGLPVDIIIDSVIWPKRQLKEGYIAISITTKDGRIFSGYEDRVEKGVLYLRDTATQEIVPIAQDQIGKRDEIGTVMLPGLTNSLTREQLRDLIAYLTVLKGSAPQLKDR